MTQKWECSTVFVWRLVRPPLVFSPILVSTTTCASIFKYVAVLLISKAYQFVFTKHSDHKASDPLLNSTYFKGVMKHFFNFGRKLCWSCWLVWTWAKYYCTACSMEIAFSCQTQQQFACSHLCHVVMQHHHKQLDPRTAIGWFHHHKNILSNT